MDGWTYDTHIYICIYIYVCVYVCMWIYDDIHMMIYDILYRWRFVTEVNLHPLTWIQPVQWAGARGVSSIAGSDSRSVTALPHNRVGEGGIDGYVGRWSAVICWSYRFLFFVTPFFWTALHFISNPKRSNNQWIGLRENLQETIDVPIKYGVFL